MRLGCCEVGTHKCNIIVATPKFIKDYKDKISIDKCIVEKIKDLWKQGIMTYGSCCGHFEKQGMVNVSEKDSRKMLKLGYKKYENKFNNSTFII